MKAGFFDLQVNGYGGVDFNQDDLSDADLHKACEKLREDGVDQILATIITEEFETMCKRLTRLAELRSADSLAESVIAGIHIEGPFLNERAGFRGAHPRDAIIPGEMASIRKLLDAAQGLARLVTLAPERDDGFAVTRYLSEQGIVVAAGHCNPSLAELDGAIDAGLSMFTHLGNGCPNQLARHFNIIQRALSRSDRLWISFIADGVHIPWFALKNYIRAAGLERCCVVSDCIAPGGLGPGRYTMGRWDLEIGNDMVARAPDGSHLIGSAMPLKHAAENLVRNVGLSEDEAHRLTSELPRAIIGKI